MKKFKYRMEPLLKMRAHLEKEKQKILAEVQKQIVIQKTEMHQLESQRSKTQENQASKTSGTFSVAELLIYSRYIQKLKQDKAVGFELIKVLEKDEAEKRKLLLAASRERKKYEKLKEKQTDNYYQEIGNDEKKRAMKSLSICIVKINLKANYGQDNGGGPELNI